LLDGEMAADLARATDNRFANDGDRYRVPVMANLRPTLLRIRSAKALPDAADILNEMSSSAFCWL
jgi:hypothetical protein